MTVRKACGKDNIRFLTATVVAASPVNEKEQGHGSHSTYPLASSISLHNIRPSGYGFCRTEDGPAAYFSLDGEQTMSETDLRVAVH